MRIVLLIIALLLTACGGGGGSSATAPLPPPAPPPAPPGGSTGAPPVAYADADALFAAITRVTIPADGRPIVDFQLSDGDNTAILDLTAADVRFIIAKHQASPLGTFHGTWQSYINRIEQPGVGPGTTPRLQATAERGTSGAFTNNGNGTYRYRLAAVINDPAAINATIRAQASAEGLDLDFDPTLTHRLSMQFDNARVALNPSYDFQPTTGAVDQIVRGLVTTTANCNACHGALALHGGGRIETDYCATCHNPGSGDANSGNGVAFDELIHKIHRGAALPSVVAGGSYGIYGFGDELHDYSGVRYPQDIRHCTACHAGSATGDGRSVATSQGDNWSEYPTGRACGACHDDVDFDVHYGGQPDDSDCRSCHALGGAAGSIARSHAIPRVIAQQQFAFEITNVTATAPGALPVVDFRVIDPSNGNAPYDIKTHPAFTQGGGASRLAVTLAWSTTDYTNTRPGAINASTVSINALTASVATGNNVFRVTSTVPIPLTATGSGAATLEGHPAADIDLATSGVETIPVTNAVRFFSINEPSGAPVPRRQVVELARCNVCHAQLVLHGDNRTDNIDGCVTCHNPRNTDRGVRAIAVTPPTDGKIEESLDFKTMVHGIHAASVRENPLQVVGFMGFNTYIYDTQTVHYPRSPADCTACHAAGTFTLPLANGVLGTSTGTGVDQSDPADDTVVTPVSAVCASCHDDAPARAHMVSNGGDFDTTQAFIDAGVTIENCETCHGPGAVVDVATAHGVSP